MLNVYDSKENCCGCGMCAQICAKSAIKLKEDKYGFWYPEIDQNLCTNCGACRKNCSFNSKKTILTKECYAAVNSDDLQLSMSASGGVFSALAYAFITDKGSVCGAAMELDNGNVTVKHIFTDSLRDLPRLQGSKYVQSYTAETFYKVLAYLKEGRKVLFSGTPCQVAAMKTYVGNQYSDLFYTIDIICHGVPSKKIFEDYIQTESEKRNLVIQNFVFRDKKSGWGHNGRITGKNFSGDSISEKINPDSSSYYRFFLDGELCRDCCYKCPFAQENRIGDLTIGDYWGAEKYSPELMRENGGVFSNDSGISCLLVNTKQEKELLKRYGGLIIKKDVNISKVKIINTRLRHPVIHSKLRYKLMKAYSEKGYDGIEKIFIIQKSRKIIIQNIKNLFRQREHKII